MSVCIVLPDLRGGGAERVMIRLANKLAKLTEVTIVLASDIERSYHDISEDVKVSILNCKPGIRSIKHLLRFFSGNEYSFVIATLNMAHAVSLIRPMLPKKTKVIARLANTIGVELSYEKNIFKRGLKLLYQYVLLLSDTVVFQSNYMQKDYVNTLKVNSEKYRVIYNPLDASQYRNVESSSKKSVRLCAVGRLDFQKDFGTLLDALSLLPECELQLDIYGTGQQYDQLAKRAIDLGIQNKVCFMGFVADLSEVLGGYDIYVQTSLYEGLSNSLIEAMAAGLTIVVTDSPGGNREIVSNEEAYYCSVKDEVSIANAIKKAIERPIDASSNVTKFAVDNIINEWLR